MYVICPDEPKQPLCITVYMYVRMRLYLIFLVLYTLMKPVMREKAKSCEQCSASIHVGLHVTYMWLYPGARYCVHCLLFLSHYLLATQ